MKVNYKKPYKMRGTAESFAIASGQNYVAVAAAFGHKPEVAHARYIDVPVFIISLQMLSNNLSMSKQKTQDKPNNR